MRREFGWLCVLIQSFSALILLMAPDPCRGHDNPNATVPSLRALKVDHKMIVDGVLDEVFWQRADVANDFTDSRSGERAEQQTRVRIAHTRTHLYIGVECFDSRMDELHATEMREDRFFRGDDWVEVHLDTAHAHNAKYAFFSNPLGTRVDASEGPSGSFSTSWSAEWDLAAKIHEDRWSFEMSIPLSILNYHRADGQTWGINFTRKRVHTDVTSFWSYNQTDSYKPRHFGHLTRLELADSEFDNNLEVTPYLSSRIDFNGETKSTIEAGGDINLRLTPSITSSFTLNPDYAQVEADADSIELRDTERFLPEKRLFFREGEELFRGSRDLFYYSRRLSDIDGGARISGTAKKNKFAFLDVYGNIANEDNDYYGNSAIMRLIHDVGEKSNLGVHASGSSLDKGHSRVLAHDGTFYLNDDWRLRYNIAGLDEKLRNDSHETVKDRTDYYGYSSLRYERYPWEAGVSYRGITEGFNPVLGYIPRRDIFGPRLHTMYKPRSSDRWYKSYFGYFSSEYYNDSNGELSLNDYSFRSGVTFQNDIGIEAGYDQDYHRPYDNQRTRLDLVFNESDYYRLTGLGWAFGTFEETPYDELIFTKHFKPLQRWPVRYEYVIRFEDEPAGGQDTIWLNRIVFDYFFTPMMWIKSSLQHRSSAVHNISAIYGWEFIKDAHFYVVYNNVREDEEVDSGQSVFLKTAYTFR